MAHIYSGSSFWDSVVPCLWYIVWRNYVCEVAATAPRRLARPQGKVFWRGSVPHGSVPSGNEKHVCVKTPCCLERADWRCQRGLGLHCCIERSGSMAHRTAVTLYLVSGTHGVPQESPTVDKSVLTTALQLSSQRAFQRVSRKSVPQACSTRASRESPTGVTSVSLQECCTWDHHKPHWYILRLSHLLTLFWH